MNKILEKIKYGSKGHPIILKSVESELLYNYITILQQRNEGLRLKYNDSTSHQINYKYFKTLYSKLSKDIVIDDLVYKCEIIQKLIEANEKLDIENNLLNQLQNGSDEK